MEVEMNNYLAILICALAAAFIGYMLGKIKVNKSYHRIKQLEEEKLGCDFEILELQRKNKELSDRLTLSVKKNGIDARISSKQD
ncbi:MAG TPA: hypothetical protein VHZ50_02125 [Puia sp.]|jgi:hypothetical protein|nr:hypothetical protein [Puia sp.]